jgi:hypothetical protein
MWSVPPKLRPLAIALNTIVLHLLGDVPSPPLIGFIQTKLEERVPPELAPQQWRVSQSIISLVLLPAGIVFLINAKISGKAKDYRTKEELNLAEAREATHRVLSGGGRRSTDAAAEGAAASTVTGASGSGGAADAAPPAGSPAVAKQPLLRGGGAAAADCEIGGVAGEEVVAGASGAKKKKGRWGKK